jgi:hypothetical protein
MQAQQGPWVGPSEWGVANKYICVPTVNLLSLDGCPSTYFFYSPTVPTTFVVFPDGWGKILPSQNTRALSKHGPCSPLWHLHALGGWQQQQPTLCATAACALKSVKWPSSAARTLNRAPSILACAP